MRRENCLILLPQSRLRFSQVSAHREGGGLGITGTRSLLGWAGMPGPFQGVGMARVVGTHPLLLTPSGIHHTYGWQAGRTYPTGMLSCLDWRLVINE